MIKSYNDIPGWFDFHAVYDLAVKEAEDGDIMFEIGCFLGKSVAYLGQKVKESGKKIDIVAVDLFEPQGEEHKKIIAETGKTMFEGFLENMSDLKLKVFAVRGKSPDVLRRMLIGQKARLVFLDDAHDYISVVEDLSSWWPEIKSGGIFAGHDYGEETAGVKRAVDEFCIRENVTMERSVASWIIRKP